MGIRDKTREKMGLGELRAYDETKGKYLDKENPQIDYTPEEYDPSREQFSEKDERRYAPVAPVSLPEETARLRSRETRREGIANRLSLGAALESTGAPKEELPPTHFSSGIGSGTEIHGAHVLNPSRGTEALDLPSARSKGGGEFGDNKDFVQNSASAAHEIEHSRGAEHTEDFGLMQAPANARDMYIAKKFLELRKQGISTPDATKMITASVRNAGLSDTPSDFKEEVANADIDDAAARIRKRTRRNVKPSS